MPNAQFDQELKSWIDTLPVWKMTLSLDIISCGSCRKEAVENALNDFLIDRGLQSAPAATEEKIAAAFAAEPAAASEVASPALTPIKLNSIHGFKSVSALRDGERIEVGPGLTVIYGSNGTGKSSYVRLLNRAFSSRGDNEILHDVFSDATGEPSCEFSFDVDGTEEIVAFPAADGHQYLQRFSVFDGQSARVHLDQKNELLFVPGGFEFFTSLNEGLDSMRRLLEQRIANRKPANPLAIAFNRMSFTGQLINGISAETTEKEISDHAVKSDTAVIEKLQRLEKELAKLKTSEVSAEVAKLESLSANLNLLVVELQKINRTLSAVAVSRLLQARMQVQRKEQEAKDTGTARFADLGVKYADSPQFKAFLVSAAAFMELRGHEDGCPYCNGPLEERGETLKNAYNTFLTSTAEKELTTARRVLANGVETLKQIRFPTLNDTQTLFTQLQKDEAGKQLAAHHAKMIEEAIQYRNNLLAQIAGTVPLREPSDFGISEDVIVVYRKSVVDEIEKLNELDPATEIVKKEAEVMLLRDRIKLGEELDSVLAYLRELKWCDRAKKQTTQFATNSVTNKQKEFFNRYVTDDYLKTFEDECKKLDAQLRVEISQQGTKGKTVRDLKVGGVDPRRVLSEGEQRATALADFLTEIQVSGNCCGLVFDDPVNSLDHERKKLIAKRIVEEANHRQVIVFTHDLVFVAKLKEVVEISQCAFCCHWIEKDGKGPGAVNLDNGPVNEADYKKSGIAQKWLLKARQSGNPEDKQAYLKLGFAAVRTNYEAFIIYDMFNEVYTRFGERISPGRLAGVVFDEGIIDQIIEKSGSLSKYIEAHLHSDEYADFKPTTDLLKQEIDEFDAMKGRMKAIKRDRSKKASTPPLAKPASSKNPPK
jgi:DNA repair exonuclease SbcCD ATPase subunit